MSKSIHWFFKVWFKCYRSPCNVEKMQKFRIVVVLAIFCLLSQCHKHKRLYPFEYLVLTEETKHLHDLVSKGNGVFTFFNSDNCLS